jgi:hypothetical protein
MFSIRKYALTIIVWEWVLVWIWKGYGKENRVK